MKMHAISYIKDPDAVLDYGFDWSDWLGSDTISSSSWAADSGITIDTSSTTTTVTTVWLSGGTSERDYLVTNEIVTAGGRTDQRSILVKVRER